MTSNLARAIADTASTWSKLGNRIRKDKPAAESGLLWSLRGQVAGGYFRPMHSIQGSTAGQAPQRPPGGYTVLVVDDEEAVRRLACRMLTWTGYQAMEATHGRVAPRQQISVAAGRQVIGTGGANSRCRTPFTWHKC